MYTNFVYTQILHTCANVAHVNGALVSRCFMFKLYMYVYGRHQFINMDLTLRLPVTISLLAIG